MSGAHKYSNSTYNCEAKVKWFDPSNFSNRAHLIASLGGWTRYGEFWTKIKSGFVPLFSTTMLKIEIEMKNENLMKKEDKRKYLNADRLIGALSRFGNWAMMQYELCICFIFPFLLSVSSKCFYGSVPLILSILFFFFLIFFSLLSFPFWSSSLPSSAALLCSASGMTLLWISYIRIRIRIYV